MNPPVAPRPITKLPGLPLVGSAFDFVGDPLGFAMRAMHRGERVLQVQLGKRQCYLIFRAEDVKQVLQENNKNYVKSDAYRAIQIFLGNGLLNSEGDFWRRQRKLAQPAFHRQKLAALVNQMNRATTNLLDRWQTLDHAAPVLVSEEMMKLTLEIVSESLFTADVKHHLDGISDALTTIIEYGYDAINALIYVPLKYPTPKNLRFKRAVDRIEAIIYGIIDARQAAPAGQHHDLLAMLMEAQDEETGERMSRQQLRDEVTTIFMAGHETTANALSWAFYLLARYPDVATRVRQEVQRVLGHDGLPTLETTRELKYTLQVVQETLRLYPPAWAFGRKSLAADRFDDYEVPADRPIIIFPYAMHRNPRYWPNPDAFDPDNFLPEREKERPTYAYIPFGGGPRLCIGNNFALMEMQIVLALAIRRLDFRSTRRVDITPEPTITLRPKHGLKLRIAPVQP